MELLKSLRRSVPGRAPAWTFLAALVPCAFVYGADPNGLTHLSKESTECVQCHKDTSRGIYEQWGESRHYRANVACYECHKAAQTEPDAFEHFGQYIATIVSPRDCAQCHEIEAAQFASSHHSKGARILGSLDNRLAEIVEGNSEFVTPGFPHGNSAAAVSGCWQCHGSIVRVLEEGRLDPATWPNTGIGRINPDGSEGSCSACHSRHTFSAQQAREPDNCGKCHMGPDHPQKEIYYESKHGIAYLAYKDKLRMDRPKWVVGEDYVLAPTCATCHMSATKDQPVTHDVGMRISWNNRPAVSIRPEAADASMGLPGKDVPWQKRRDNMKNVCLNCHNSQWVDNFYEQYDALLDLYHGKFARPGLALMAAARPLLRPAEFSNRLDFLWYELWHHEGRRARMGVSMMGPDYTHWHGTYEVAKRFYAEFVPELEDLVHKGRDSKDPEKIKAADALQAKLREILESPDHRWFENKMDPAEVERRRKAAEEFNARYQDRSVP